MKIGVVLNSKEPETAWNAFRLANAARQKGHQVTVFLLGPGVEVGDIQDKVFKVKSQMERFMERGGELMACGTCLKVRQKEGGQLCPAFTLDDLLALVEESDRVVTFG